MANQEISLKWNGYQNNILCNVKELFKDDRLADVTLVSEGCSFKAHKVILSANSSVFRRIFQQNPHKDPIIVLHDVDNAALRTLLTFMYNGEVNVTEEFLPVLLKTADTLRVCGLSTNGENIKEHDNSVEVPQIPKKRKRSEHEEGCCKHIKKVPHTTLPKADNTATNNDLETKTSAEPIIPKVEPIDSPLTDYSGDTNDIDTVSLEDTNKKNSLLKMPDNIQCLTNGQMKKCNNEVTSTQCEINSINKNNCLDTEEEKECIEIDKEVENVLQNGTIVESLSIGTGECHNKDKSNGCYSNPMFPCPFCPRIYNSWGYRRRHVKSLHRTNKLTCKWCVLVMGSTGEWYWHTTRAHGIPHEEARNSLVVVVEAHAVLTLAEPSVAQLLRQAGLADTGEVKESKE